jgi:hypothetical protein
MDTDLHKVFLALKLKNVVGIDNDKIPLYQTDILAIENNMRISVQQIDQFQLFLPVCGVVLPVIRHKVHRDPGILRFVMLFVSDNSQTEPSFRQRFIPE